MFAKKNFNLELLLNNAKTDVLCIFSARSFGKNSVVGALRLWH